MGLLTFNRSRLLGAVIIAVLVAVSGCLLLEPDWRLGEFFLHTSYDSLHLLAGVRSDAMAKSDVVIVYLDLDSFNARKLDPAKPWPRDLHARLINRLSDAAARTIVFDILFAQAGPSPEADVALADAIQRSGRVILAAEHNQSTVAPDESSNWGSLGKLELPIETFARSAVGWGMASHAIDDDLVVRRYVAGFDRGLQPTLTWSTANWLHLPVIQSADSLSRANQRWVRYYGPPFLIPHVSYKQALEPGGIDDAFFRDKIVLVGGRPSVDQFNKKGDEFRNPFHLAQFKHLFMPGVEVHATEMLNLVRSDWLRRFSTSREIVIVLVCALVFGGGLIWLKPIPAAFVALAGVVLGPLIARYAFLNDVWFPWLIISGAQIPMALGGAVLYSSIEWRRARRQFEIAKRIADEKIREQAALIDKAHDAILVQDLDGTILYANASALHLYGWSLSELQQNGAHELFSSDPGKSASASSIAQSKGEWNGELRLQTRAGKLIEVDSRWTLIRDEQGKPRAMLLINSDVTEKKELEAQFLRTQRMNTIGSIAGGMAHDLNNALAPILMGIQLLRRKSNDDESTRLLSLIEANTHRGAEMVRQVLLFARGRGGELERIELSALVKELERIVRETFPRNISVESFFPHDLWPVQANPTQIHQVLLNLCVNARDAMPEGGKLSFVADNVDLSSAEAASMPDGKAGQFVSLLVSDTGTGMPAEVRARIFEPFFTTKSEGLGTGIGLSTVLRIIRSHAGFLRVESQPGEGTTFEIFLPRAADSPVSPAQPTSAEIPHGSGETILVVDDEQAIRDLVSEGLTIHGYRVFKAADGQEALQLLRSTNIQLLITDSAMPVMDGPKLIAEAQKLRRDLPIILASGESHIANGEAHRGILLLSKPFALEEILSSVHRLLPRQKQ